MKYALKVLNEEGKILKGLVDHEEAERSERWRKLRDINAAIDILSSIERAHPR